VREGADAEKALASQEAAAAATAAAEGAAAKAAARAAELAEAARDTAAAVAAGAASEAASEARASERALIAREAGAAAALVHDLSAEVSVQESRGIVKEGSSRRGRHQHRDCGLKQPSP